MSRAVAAVLLLLAPAPVAAQPTPAPQHGPPPPRVAHKPTANDFEVATWLSLMPAAQSLIRAPSGQSQVDLSARDDDTYITVYARKKRPDLGPRPDTGYTPGDATGATPDYDHVRYLPPTHCANGAYNTVAGQSANASDLIGFLGSGDGC